MNLDKKIRDGEWKGACYWKQMMAEGETMLQVRVNVDDVFMG